MTASNRVMSHRCSAWRAVLIAGASARLQSVLDGAMSPEAQQKRAQLKLAQSGIDHECTTLARQRRALSQNIFRLASCQREDCDSAMEKYRVGSSARDPDFAQDENDRLEGRDCSSRTKSRAATIRGRTSLVITGGTSAIVQNASPSSWCQLQSNTACDCASAMACAKAESNALDDSGSSPGSGCKPAFGAGSMNSTGTFLSIERTIAICWRSSRMTKHTRNASDASKDASAALQSSPA